MSGLISDTVDEVIEYYRPYEIEKRRLRSLVNFKVISEFFAKGCLYEFMNKEHQEAKNHNRKIDIIGGN